MASSPKFKLYTAGNVYLGCLKHLEDCAAVIANQVGGTIRCGHTKKSTIWTEGVDGRAGDSYDEVARIGYERVEAMAEAVRAKQRRVMESS